MQHALTIQALDWGACHGTVEVLDELDSEPGQGFWMLHPVCGEGYSSYDEQKELTIHVIYGLYKRGENPDDTYVLISVTDVDGDGSMNLLTEDGQFVKTVETRPVLGA